MAKHVAHFRDARMGELWVLTDMYGQVRPHVRSDGGWRSFGRRNRLFHSDNFLSGYRIWSPEDGAQP